MWSDLYTLSCFLRLCFLNVWGEAFELLTTSGSTQGLIHDSVLKDHSWWGSGYPEDAGDCIC